MDTEALRSLARLLRSQRTLALGTLHEAAPFVSLALYAEAPDLARFYLHLSRLALHTRGLLADGRAGLMIAEPDRRSKNPLTLGRASIQGEAQALSAATPDFEAARALYLAKFPFAEINFGLGDFGLFAITPLSARYVADFGKIYDLTLDDFKEAGRLE